MRKIIIIFTLLLPMSFLVLSCQKTKEAEKSTALVRSEQASGQSQQEQRKSTPNRECSNDLTGSPLTNEEQAWFDKIGGSLQTPSQLRSQAQAKKYLRIMLKGNHKTNTWYTPPQGQTEERMRWIYSLDMETAIDALDPTDKDAFILLVEVLKTKSCYPEAMAKAARKVKYTKDKSLIPVLREAAKNKNQGVQFEATGSLLVLGDADTALPVLEKFVNDGYSKALYYLFKGSGQIIDERGYTIVEKALNSSNAEVKISAVDILLDAKKITKEKAEGIELAILKELMNKSLKDYGLMRDPKNITEIISLPGYSITDVKSAEQLHLSNSRACEMTISMLAAQKNKEAVAFLRNIEKNNYSDEAWYNCKYRNAKDALRSIEGGRQ